MNTMTPLRNTPATPSRCYPNTSKAPRFAMTPPRSSAKRRRIVTTPGDRFVPNRARMNLESCNSSIRASKKPSQECIDVSESDKAAAKLQSDYKRRMKAAILDIPLEELSDDGDTKRILHFGENKRTVSPYVNDPSSHDTLHVLQRLDNINLRGNGAAFESVSTERRQRISKTPFRILDAPALADDFYVDTLSWNSSDVLAVALQGNVYLYDFHKSAVSHLMNVAPYEGGVSCVSWAHYHNDRVLAIATQAGNTELWDVQAGRRIRTMSGHLARVGSIAWNKNIMTSGSRDSSIIHHDVRMRYHIVARCEAHLQEVCGLKWNAAGDTLASGGNDNRICLWDAKKSSAAYFEAIPSTSPRLTLDVHKAAVKALAWCPFRPRMLASGSGTTDGTIKLWNTNNGEVQHSVETKSQVTDLLWSKHRPELLSSHSWGANELTLWSYTHPELQWKDSLESSGCRVLNLDQSNDGSAVVCGTNDERLVFRNVFGTPPPFKRQESVLDNIPFGQAIR